MELNGKYFLDDPESGGWYEVSKSEHDAHIERMKSITKEAISLGYKPQIYLAGTSDSSNSDSFEKLWKENVR